LKYYFILLIINRQISKYILLIFNSYKLHLISKFNNLYYINYIISIYIPPSLLHFCQPLDIFYFIFLKKIYYSLIERLARARYLKINKNNFLKKYPKAYIIVFKKANIQNAFKISGLVLYDLS
ncbi:hypothetical protein ASPACDRAFT_37684, partial [Aspergillus aculeatus ATCC 16872]